MQQQPTDDLRVEAALTELRALVRTRYPDASFQVVPAPDDPDIIHLIAEVAVDDTDDVLDLVMDRMIDLQVVEGLPIYVVPQRTPELIAARRLAQATD